MDPAVPKDIWWFIDNFWSSMVVALVIYGGGLTATRVALSFVPAAKDYLDTQTKVEPLDPEWPLLFRLWAVTRIAHPFVVGALISFVPDLPRPAGIYSGTSAVLWFGFVGMANGQIHLLGEAVAHQAGKAVGLIVPWARARLGLPPATPSTPPATPSSALPVAEAAPMRLSLVPPVAKPTTADELPDDVA